jgi:hypothetical protein
MQGPGFKAQYHGKKKTASSVFKKKKKRAKSGLILLDFKT